MDEEAAFLAAIAAEPDEDLPRLAYADWLTENGRADRAEFIRVQCELARSKPPLGLDRNAPVGMFGERERRFHKWGKNSPWGRQRAALRARERELWHGTVAVQIHGPLCQLLPGSVATIIDHRHRNMPGWEFLVRRGFVWSAKGAAADWLAHADSILAAHPVREVTLTTWPEWEWCDGHGRASRVPCIIGNTPMRLVGRGQHHVKYSEPAVMRIESLLRAEWPTVKTWNLPADTSRFEVGTNTYLRDIMEAMREAGNRSAMRQNEAFLRAFLGE